MKRYLILLLILASCKSQPQGNPFGDKAQPVHVAEVKAQDVPLYIEVMGRIDSPLTVELRAQVNGKLKEMHVAQGQEVKAGDRLFTIEPASYQASVDQARATHTKDESALTFAKAKLERYQPLAKQEYVSQLHYDQFHNDVDTLASQALCSQAALELAEIDLGYCTITAPMDGKIGEARVDPGNLVGPADPTPLAELRQLDPINVRFTLTQKDFQAIKATHRDMELAIEVIEENGNKKTGQVYFIDNHLDTSTGTLLCKGKLANEERALWPGEYVRVRLTTKSLPQALLVPIAAVQLGQSGPYVYIVKPDMTVEMRQVTVEARQDGQVIISSGLNAGESAVIDGQLNLRPGSKVSVSKVSDTTDKP
ncbi:MAG: efflux RND transporter periplasmic adaptor subunit [Parachlamydia sp.]|nr:efflux RND transporter periplasmic adaptor subunit [Parachlamydia sp.]